MRSTRILLLLAAAACAFGPAASGCSCGGGDTPPAADSDGGNVIPPDAGPLEFTTFVRDLIQNNTTDTAVPTSIDQNFVDSEPTDAFPPTFFQSP